MQRAVSHHTCYSSHLQHHCNLQIAVWFAAAVCSSLASCFEVKFSCSWWTSGLHTSRSCRACCIIPSPFVAKLLEPAALDAAVKPHTFFLMQVIHLVEKPRDPPLQFVFADTPGQIEIFTWSASGQLVTGEEVQLCVIPASRSFIAGIQLYSVLRCDYQQSLLEVPVGSWSRDLFKGSYVWPLLCIRQHSV
jgi:hypothetical protein